MQDLVRSLAPQMADKGKRIKRKTQTTRTLRASMVTTQGEMEVPRFLAPKGPRGIYSHFWMSLADQSFIRTIPKMCLSASWAVMESPMGGQSPPTKKAISSSKSIRRHGPNLGGSVSTGLFHQKILQIFFYECKEKCQKDCQGPGLSIWSSDWGTGNNNRRGSTVVADLSQALIT